MGRENKVGLDYFDLDCHMDEKIELIEAEYGLKGFAIVVKLYQSIYSRLGYYCEWTPDISLLWAARLGGSHGGAIGKVGSASDEGSLPGFPKNLINDVVAASIRRGIFSEELFKKYQILTSSGIQKRYLSATSKREKVELKKEYLLISIPQNRENVVINAISDGRNAIFESKNAQSRQDNIKVYNIVESEKQNSTDAEIKTSQGYKPSDFELWCVDYLIQSILVDFPNQKVPRTDPERKKWALHIERMQRIDGLSMEQIRETLVWTMQDGFWRTNIRSTGKFREKFQTLYLQSRRNGGSRKNAFNDFKQNDYDFNKLEQELLSN